MLIMSYRRVESNSKHEEGFTLLETLLVLLVASLLLIIPTLSIGHMVESLELDLFFREVTSNITLMQNHAILAGKRTEVKFLPHANRDEIHFQVATNHPLNRIMVLDSPYYSLRGRGYTDFRFLKDTGNISDSETIGFNTSQGDYILTYLLGSGRFDIKKETNK